jgi:hypothetical protein
MEEFLKDDGFYYDEDNDEWIRPFIGGEFRMFRKLHHYYIWSLSFVDIDDNQYFLIETSDIDEMLSTIKIFKRDKLVDNLLNLF